MQHQPFLGLVAATHTPFHADGSLNLDAVQQQAEHLLANGLQAAFIGGTTGESHSLTCEERLQLTTRWAEVARGTPLRVMVHVGANCLQDAAVLAAHAQKAGAAAISAMAPSYFKPRSLDLLVECCRVIAAAAPNTPFYYYDIPILTGVSFPMTEFMEAGATRIGTLAGIKFTCADLMGFQQCLRAGGGRFDVLWGFDEYSLATMALGARGAVGSTYNFAAPVYQRMQKFFSAGDLPSAQEEQFRSVQLVAALVKYGFMGSAKALMGMLGVPVGPARLPNGNPTPEQCAALRADLEGLGFFDWIRR